MFQKNVKFLTDQQNCFKKGNVIDKCVYEWDKQIKKNILWDKKFWKYLMIQQNYFRKVKFCWQIYLLRKYEKQEKK